MSDETTFVSEIPTATDVGEAIFITPGEGKQPVSLLGDEFCEELAYPHLFPSSKFGCKAERENQISPSRYFYKKPLNYIARNLRLILITFSLPTQFYRNCNLIVR